MNKLEKAIVALLATAIVVAILSALRAACGM